MPWEATEAMKERVNFVLEWERRWNEAQGGWVDMAELCRKYGVSRPTGYNWVNRFREASHDIRALEEESRRPLSNPHAISPQVEDLIVEARKTMPNKGPRKLRKILLDRSPGIEWPSTTSIGNILKRRGLCRLRKRRRRGPPATEPSAATREPNDTWCIDFKGKFRMQDGHFCHVLTLMDADTRFLLRAEPMLEPNGENVEIVLDSAFQEFGSKKRCRRLQPISSNSAASSTNGAATTTRCARTRLSATRRLPSSTVATSTLSLPAAEAESAELAPGVFRWNKHRLFVTSALSGEIVELERSGETTWRICFLDHVIGEIDERKPDRGIVMKRKPQLVDV